MHVIPAADWNVFDITRTSRVGEVIRGEFLPLPSRVWQIDF